MHVYGLDEFVDKHSPFALGCGFPESVYVDLCEVRSDLVELLGDISGALLLCRLLVFGGSQRFDLCRETVLFFGEQVGGDLAGVVQPQELAAFLDERSERGRGRGCRRAAPLAGLPLAGCQLHPDRIPQAFIRADQHQPEHGRSMQATSRATRRRAAGAPIATAVVDMARAVVLDVHPLSTPSATNTTRQQITPTTPTGDTPSKRRSELVGRDDRIVLAGIPLAVQQYFTEVDPRVQDLSHE